MNRRKGDDRLSLFTKGVLARKSHLTLFTMENEIEKLAASKTR